MRPRILYLSPFCPDHMTSASEVRAVHVGRALQQFGDVEVVVVGNDASRAVAGERSGFEVVDIVEIQARLNAGVGQKVNWLLAARRNYPHGLGVDQEGFQRVLRIAEGFDIVWFFKLRTANAFPCWSWPHSVVDIDDVPSTFEQSVLSTQKAMRERVPTSLRIWSWRRRERLLGERFTAITVCSQRDEHYLQALGVRAPIHVVPNGYERPPVDPVHKTAAPPRLGFIGVFDHRPNVVGIEWFARECWPSIKREVPAARLRLVGRFSDGPLKPAGADIDGLGWLEDPADEMSTWSAMVVPVHLGAGTRGKIAHAFSRKCPVVSTALGAYGYDAKDGREMLLAESSEAFTQACLRILREPAAATAMAERAWQKFLTNWTWDATVPRVWAAAEDCLRSKQDADVTPVA